MPSPSPPELVNSVLIKALAHPTRVHALTFLFEGPMTPREIATRLDLPINNLMHHIHTLERLGCIELVNVGQARGGRVGQSVYRAVERPYLDAAAWEQLGSVEKVGFISTIFRLISGDVSEAMVNGTMYDPDDNHLSRSPMNVDAEGWQEVVELLDGTVGGLEEIQGNVLKRSGGTFPIKVAILQFRSPSKKKPAG